ncbi:stalk domain-containing protein [Paenibacillus popilliae]|uniref:VWFA domain-containing protein n=1 Tax=Paenibacillus popilliae ATCC 14706 TaxID=1212764 RepID=M9LNZ2_PAEPP|nr:stalk domain-containing protein [Paenibacillus popilliae]GAC42136.1 uncharacterized protein PPOP_1493 [Paenibacillus popilliae ATCC 14706]
MKQRVLSVVLALIMVLSIVPVSALATESDSLGSTEGLELLRAEWLANIVNEVYMRDQPEEISASTSNLISMMTIPPGSLSINKESTSMTRTFITSDTTKIYTVLVLDRSGSMYGKPLDALKKAAVKFCNDVLKAEGEHYVAVVTYGTDATVVCNFTTDYTALQTSINGIYEAGISNTNQGLVEADNLLSSIANETGTIKNILLLSDGLPNMGEHTYLGRYTYSDHYLYQFANAVYNTVPKGKGYYIYSLGFFHNLDGSELAFARRFMNDLQNVGYHDVVNPDDLEIAFEDIAEDITTFSGTFRYASPIDDVENKKKNYDDHATYYYTDEYFDSSSYAVWDSANKRWKYNDSLATMSLCLELSAWGSNEDGVNYTNKSKNARKLLDDIGFKDSSGKSTFEASDDFKIRPERDSIGAVAAHKKITVDEKDYTLIALAIRGGGYGAEWAGNFRLGETGQHEGFEIAKERVLTFLREYIKNKGITGDIKLWLTGFSRAAATANLVAGALDDGADLGNCTLTPENLYAFCFEAPAGALYDNVHGKSLYNNIINIINPNDLVTKVAPATAPFRFARYGVDIILPTASNDFMNYGNYKQRMLQQFFALQATKTYTVDNFRMRKFGMAAKKGLPPLSVEIVNDIRNNVDQSDFLDTAITKIAKNQLKSRSNYVKEFQDDLREALAIILGADDDQWKQFSSLFVDKLSSPFNMAKLIASTTWIGKLAFGSIVGQIEQYAVESLEAAGISTYNKSQINGVVVSPASIVLKFVVSHPKLTATFACNLDGIGSAHYPELCLAWLQSRDPNYTSNAFWVGTTGSYRIVRVNCPVDVEVYAAESNELVAAIISDEPQTVADSTIISAVNEDGEKLIYLPADADFSVRLTATDDGEMTYSVNEYCFEAGEVSRVVNYYEVPIATGMMFSGNIPAYGITDIENGMENGSSSRYSLSCNGTEIVPDEDLTGSEAMEAYFVVEVLSENEEHGTVTGQGVRQLGNYAQISAIANDGYEFEGWYVDNNKVSSTTEYRFIVKSDVTLLAKFTLKNSTNPYTITATAGTGGAVTGSGSYASGGQVTLTARANRGYSFDGWYESSARINGAGASYTFAASANRTLEARFTYVGTGGNSGSGGSGHGAKLPNQQFNNVDANVDAMIIEQLDQGKNPDVNMADSVNSIAISGSTLSMVQHANKALTIKKGIVSLGLSPENIAEMNIESDDKVVIDVAQSAAALTMDVEKTDKLNSKLLVQAYDINIVANHKKPEALNTPLIIHFNLTDFELSDEQKSKITGVRYLNEEKYNQLGGKMISNNLFEAKTSKLGKYGILISDMLVSVVTTIDKNTYTVNGETKTSDVAPMIIDRRTMVPIRFIAEAFGADVGWEQATKQVTINLEGKTLSMAIGQLSSGIDVPPMIVNKRTLVPLRYVSEQLDANVIWNEATRSIDIYR